MHRNKKLRTEAVFLPLPFFVPFFTYIFRKMRRKKMKYRIITTVALTGSALAKLCGGWDMALQTLLIFIAVDWITGGILLPAVFKKSPKSANGSLESRAGWKGLCRKAMIFFYVLIASRLDLLLGTDYVRNAVCIGFIANEALSIVENAGLMGVPLPDVIKKSIEVLKTGTESGVN